MLVSHAQNLEDVVLWRVLGHIESGTYVDVGAADPDEDSVTRVFYDRGWNGANVEPLPQFAARLREARPRDVTIEACAGATAGEVELAAVEDTGLSTLSPAVRAELEHDGYTVTTITARIDTLDSLLEEAGFDGRDIHFLKVDVEGFELETLQGVDLARWRPWILIVEATHPRTGQPSHASWEPLVLEAGYRRCLFDGLNRFYVSPDHADLAEQLSYPACVLDQPYVSGPHGQLLADHHDLQASAENLQAEIARLLGEHERLEQTMRDHMAAYERLETEYHRALGSYERLEAEHLATVESYQRLDAEHADMADAMATLRLGVREMRDELEHVRSAASDAETRASQAARELEAVTGSTIWRVTAPLRRGLDVARRLR